MAYSIEEVPLQFVNVVWPSIEGFVASALEHAEGDLVLDEVKSYCINGMWKLYVAVDEENIIHGAAVVNFYNRINSRVAFITAIGGKRIFTPENFSQFSELLRLNGATCVEGSVRDSLVRFTARLGARKKTTTVHISL